MELREAFVGDFNRWKPYQEAKLFLDDPVSIGEITRMERQAIAMIERWTDEYDRIFTGNSGGIDSMVLGHLAARAGVTDSVTVTTPESYPQHQEYCEEWIPKIGNDLNFSVVEWMDIEWLSENPEYVFPRYDKRMEMVEKRQRQHLIDYGEEVDADLRLYGRRTAQNHVPDYLYDRGGTLQGFPIRDWKFKHIARYLEKHDIPVSPCYTMHRGEVLGNAPWHVRDSWRNDERIEAEAESWWAVRDFARESFWERITEYFPEGETKADEWEVEHVES